MKDLSDLKRRPIPSSEDALRRRGDYRLSVPIDLAGPMASEGCLDAREEGVAGCNHYNSPFNPPYYVTAPGSLPELFVRLSVLSRLRAVNDRLRRAGLEIFLYDAWRPQAIQRFFHDEWFPAWLRERRPDLEGDRLVEEVEKYWSAPTSGPASPSPHSTGGALDLTLIFSHNRQPLFMGGIFDDLTRLAWTDGCEGTGGLSMSDDEARANRRLLYWVMTEAGFSNNPTEWWHYSWGDQMWARLTGASAAVFGACDPLGMDVS